MPRILAAGVLVLAALIALALALGQDDTPEPEAAPALPAAVPPALPAPAPVCPGPDCPDCPSCPKPRPRPWGPRGEPVGSCELGSKKHANLASRPCDCGCGGKGDCGCEPYCPCSSYRDPYAEAQNRTDPQSGRPIQIDLPASQHLRNHPAGGGCCVFASMDHAARWHNITPLIGVLNDDIGGGWPRKVDETIARRYPGYKSYVQAEGRNNVVRLLDWALPSGRIACVTYGQGHMVNMVHLDAQRSAFLDNNRPGVFQWMSRAQGLQKVLAGKWAYTFLEAPPPPVPVN